MTPETPPFPQIDPRDFAPARLLWENLLLRRYPAPRETATAKIVLPDSAVDPRNLYWVEKVGENVRAPNGQPIRRGETVLVKPHAVDNLEELKGPEAAPGVPCFAYCKADDVLMVYPARHEGGVQPQDIEPGETVIIDDPAVTCTATGTAPAPMGVVQ